MLLELRKSSIMILMLHCWVPTPTAIDEIIFVVFCYLVTFKIPESEIPVPK